MEETSEKMKIYFKYLDYLKEWANERYECCYYGQSPACFDEWHDNEYQLEDEE